MAWNRPLLPALLVVAALSVGCGEKIVLKGHDKSPIVNIDSCPDYSFSIDSLPYKAIPFTAYPSGLLTEKSEYMDSDHIPLLRVDSQFFYQPLGLIRNAVEGLNGYRATSDSAYYRFAMKYIKRLRENSNHFGGAIYFPYKYDYEVHQRDIWKLQAPWYSGMTQGEGLRLFVRAFLATGDSSYLAVADSVFKSFTRLKGKYDPWVVFETEAGCYWIEEYPLDPPSFTLNGFIFGLYGVYEYYLLTKNEAAYDVLQNSLSTLKTYLPYFRRPGRPSFYNLTMGHFAANYHLIHIGQCRKVYEMTGDEFFKAFADTLAMDYNSRSQ